MTEPLGRLFSSTAQKFFSTHTQPSQPGYKAGDTEMEKIICTDINITTKGTEHLEVFCIAHGQNVRILASSSFLQIMYNIFHWFLRILPS